MKSLDLVAICNALVDVLYEVPDSVISELSLTKGIMHLVDAPRQSAVLNHLKGRKHTIELGGSSLNAMRTVASLGLKTSFAGMIGKDDFGKRISERMQQLRIESHLGLSDKEPTGSCLILITPDGERTMNTNLGASRLYDSSHVPNKSIENAKILHFCGYQWDTEGQMSGIKNALATAKRSDTLVSFDLADPFVVERNRDAFHQIIKDYADIVFCNKEEARLMFQCGPAEAAEQIAALGAVAVVKVGAEGALVRHGDSTHKIAPYTTRVIDTTAAGDMFAAGFLYGRLKDHNYATCGRMGAYLASDVISRIGATVSENALGSVVAIR